MKWADLHIHSTFIALKNLIAGDHKPLIDLKNNSAKRF